MVDGWSLGGKRHNWHPTEYEYVALCLLFSTAGPLIPLLACYRFGCKLGASAPPGGSFVTYAAAASIATCLLVWCPRLRICLLCESKITAETWDCLPQSQMSGISAVSQSCAVYIEWEGNVFNRYFPFIAHEQWSQIGWFGRTWRQNIETTKRLLLLQTLWALQKVCSLPKPSG